MKAKLLDLDHEDVLAEGHFDDPQDAVRFLWDEAEKADERAGKLVGELDGERIPL